MTPLPPSPAPPSHWQEHEGLNCYQGNGAIATPGVAYPFSWSSTLQHCEAACESTVGCEAMIVPTQRDKPIACYFIQQLVIDECATWPGYSLITQATNGDVHV
jgi:hypothetical protein